MTAVAADDPACSMIVVELLARLFLLVTNMKALKAFIVSPSANNCDCSGGEIEQIVPPPAWPDEPPPQASLADFDDKRWASLLDNEESEAWPSEARSKVILWLE